MGKSLGVVFHPTNPETGKVNAQMWQVGNHEAIRGEANMLAFVTANKSVQDEIMSSCYKHVDATVVIDADGIVVGDDSLDGIEIDL